MVVFCTTHCLQSLSQSMDKRTSSKKYSALILIALLLGIALLRMLDQSSTEVIEASKTSARPLDLPLKEDPPTTITQEAVVETPTDVETVTTTTLAQIIPEEIQQLRREAMATLRELYVAEKVFHAEFNRFTSDFLALTFLPGKKEMKFRAGFIEESRIPGGFDPNSAAENPRRKDFDAFLEMNQELKEDVFRYSDSTRDHQLETYSHLCRSGCTADEKSFEVLLVMPLGPDQGVDVWSVTHDKTITLLQDGFSPDPTKMLPVDQ